MLFKKDSKRYEKSPAMSPQAHALGVITCHHHFRCPVCRKILAYTAREIKALQISPILKEIITFWRINDRNCSLANRIQRAYRHGSNLFTTTAQQLLNLVQVSAHWCMSDTAVNIQTGDIVQRLNLIIKHGSQLKPIETEAILFKCIERITQLEALLVKKIWKNQAGQLRKNSKRHESRPLHVNLDTEESPHTETTDDISNMASAVEGIFNFIAGRTNNIPNTRLQRQILDSHDYLSIFNPVDFNPLNFDDIPMSEALDVFIGLTRSLIEQ